MVEIEGLLGTLAFPIVATIAMWRFMTGDFKKEMSENTKAIRQLTTAVIELINNEKLINTN